MSETLRTAISGAMTWLRRGLWMILIGFAAVRAAAFCHAAYRERQSPLEVVYLEAGMTERCARVASGQPIYVDWSKPPHRPNFFTPGHFLLVGWIGQLLHADFDELTLIGRTSSIAAVFATSLAIGWAAMRHFGVAAAFVSALFSLGTSPSIGFGYANRPDALADLLGLVGFLLVVCPSRTWLAGALLLAAAAFTKQTAGIYLFAAVATMFFRRRLSTHVKVPTGGRVLVAAIAIFVAGGFFYSFGQNPKQFWSDIFGERLLPWSTTHLGVVAFKLLVSAPDLLVLTVFGFWDWRREGKWPLAILTASVTLGTFLAACKVGSDLNYFLPLRAPAALAVGGLLHADRNHWKLAILLPAMIYSMVGQMNAAAKAERDWRYFQLGQAPDLMAAVNEAKSLARNPAQRAFTDVGLLALQQGPRAAFVDPWLFRQLVLGGHINPAPLSQAFDRGEFELLVMSADLHSPGFDDLPFSLPPPLSESARRKYVPAGQLGPWLVHRRREANAE